MTAMMLIWVHFCGAQTRNQERLYMTFDLTVGLPISHALRFAQGSHWTCSTSTILEVPSL